VPGSESNVNEGHDGVSETPSIRNIGASDAALAETLKLRFFPGGDDVEARNVMRARSGSVEFTLCELHYKEWERKGENRYLREVGQTVAHYEPQGLRLPQFELRPRSFFSSLLYRILGLKHIDFPSHPQFNDAYHLSSLDPDLVRRLFNASVLDAFSGRPGLYVTSSHGDMVIYRKNQINTGEELQACTGVAGALFALFEDAARQAMLTEDFPLRPKPDVRTRIANMPGLFGDRMRKNLVTRDDAAAFVRQVPPRRIPSSLRAYVEKQAPQMFMGLGIIFASGGTFFMYGFGRQAFDGSLGSLSSNIRGVLFGLLFVVIGTPTAFFSMRARHRIKRLLRRGQVGEGMIEEVQSTGTRLNNVEQFMITVRYSAGGREIRATCKNIGYGAERARRFAAAGKRARILYDPDYPERVLLLDALLSYSPELDN
jgi:hypothetical protein